MFYLIIYGGIALVVIAIALLAIGIFALEAALWAFLVFLKWLTPVLFLVVVVGVAMRRIRGNRKKISFAGWLGVVVIGFFGAALAGYAYKAIPDFQYPLFPAIHQQKSTPTAQVTP